MADNFADIGFAKLDLSRGERTGFSEAIYCAGKTREQLLGILQKFHNEHIAVMGTHCSEEKYAFVKNAGLTTDYDPISQIISIGKNTIAKLPGKIAVCAAGTADMPVAEDHCQTPRKNCRLRRRHSRYAGCGRGRANRRILRRNR